MSRVLGTECAKCYAEMPALARASSGIGAGVFANKVEMIITGYLCKECGHWNNLKRRKWFKEKKNEKIR